MKFSKNDNIHDPDLLREKLAELRYESILEKELRDHPVFKKGLEEGKEEGIEAGYSVASQKFREELHGLQTLITALIESKHC